MGEEQAGRLLTWPLTRRIDPVLESAVASSVLSAKYDWLGARAVVTRQPDAISSVMESV